MNFSITPSHIIEYLFCPRFTYFEYVLGIPQYEEKHYKVMRGREMHEKILEKSKDYLRRRIGAEKKFLDQYMTISFLRGRVDEVLELSDGTMAPLDYKFAVFENSVYLTHKIQLCCYAVLIEANYKKPVNKGFLVYVRNKNKLVELDVSDNDKDMVIECARAVVQIITKSHYPRATRSKARCIGCTYANICTK